MTKKDWAAVVSSVFLTIGIDQLTKLWALNLTEIHFWGWFGLALHFNPGAMLGLFSELPAVLRVVSLSTGGAFLFFTFVVIQYLLPIKSMTLRVGLGILLGGILGNVIDRILYGHVVDFLIIRNSLFATGVFNIADALQWVAYGMVVYSLIKEGEILWPENERRGRIWINPKYQWRYSLILVFAGFAFSLISGVFSYTFLRVSLLDVLGGDPRRLEGFLEPFVISFVLIAFAFSIMMFLVGRKLSHRTIGPIHAFEKFFQDLFEGKPRKFKLRTGDEFPQLEELANRLAEEYARKTGLSEEKKTSEPHQEAQS